jgi:hypothetical protein
MKIKDGTDGALKNIMNPSHNIFTVGTVVIPAKAGIHVEKT